jgi:hypothetical protein
MPLISISRALIAGALRAINTYIPVATTASTLAGVVVMAVFCLTVTAEAETAARTNSFPMTLHIPVEVVVHNADMLGFPETGLWGRNAYAPEYWRISYLHDGNSTNGKKWVMFRPTIPANCRYCEVYMWWPKQKNGQRTNNVQVDIAGAMGTTTLIVSQARHANQWVLLDTVAFVPGTNGWVKVIADGNSDGHVSANAVRFLEIGFTYFHEPKRPRASRLIYAEGPMSFDSSVLRSMRE